MKKIPTQVKIGIFGVLMIVLLYLGINYVKSKKIFGGNNTFYVEYSNADGLEVSSPVLIKGFKVGTVDKLSFDIEHSTVIVMLSIDSEYPIPNDSKAQITTTGLLGGKVIDIILGNSSEPYENKSYLIPLQQQNLLSIAGDEYQKLKQEATSLIERLGKVLSGVNSLLSDENIQNISKMLESLNNITANMDDVLASQKKNLETLLVNISEISASLNNEMPKLSNTLTNIQDLSSNLTQEVPYLVQNASASVEKLNDILTKMSSNDSTMGQLINSSELHDNVADAINALTILLQDIKSNPKRYINVSVFGGK